MTRMLHTPKTMMARHTFIRLCCGITAGTALCEADTPTGNLSLLAHAQLVGRKLHIVGNTDAPDGCVIEWELRHQELYGLNSEDTDTTAAEGSVHVRGGAFVADVDLKFWKPGTVQVWIALQPEAFGTPQPAAVTQLIGERGEKLKGPNVHTVGAYGDLKRLVSEQIVRLP